MNTFNLTRDELKMIETLADSFYGEEMTTIEEIIERAIFYGKISPGTPYPAEEWLKKNTREYTGFYKVGGATFAAAGEQAIPLDVLRRQFGKGMIELWDSEAQLQSELDSAKAEVQNLAEALDRFRKMVHVRNKWVQDLKQQLAAIKARADRKITVEELWNMCSKRQSFKEVTDEINKHFNSYDTEKTEPAAP